MNKILVPLSDTDIKKSLGPTCRIIEYSHLADYDSIDQLLTSNYDYVVILIETTSQNVGHWVCLLKYDNTVEFFNSYGKPPDYQKNKLISPQKNKEFGQTENLLNALLLKTNYRIVFNNVDLQLFVNHSETCGRYVINRIKQHTVNKLDLVQYLAYLLYLKNHYKFKSYDELITVLEPI
jgi:hypothetical protein